MHVCASKYIKGCVGRYDGRVCWKGSHLGYPYGGAKDCVLKTLQMIKILKRKETKEEERKN